MKPTDIEYGTGIDALAYTGADHLPNEVLVGILLLIAGVAGGLVAYRLRCG